VGWRQRSRRDMNLYARRCQEGSTKPAHDAFSTVFIMPNATPVIPLPGMAMLRRSSFRYVACLHRAARLL